MSTTNYNNYIGDVYNHYCNDYIHKYIVNPYVVLLIKYVKSRKENFNSDKISEVKKILYNKVKNNIFSKRDKLYSNNIQVSLVNPINVMMFKKLFKSDIPIQLFLGILDFEDLKSLISKSTGHISDAFSFENIIYKIPFLLYEFINKYENKRFTYHIALEKYLLNNPINQYDLLIYLCRHWNIAGYGSCMELVEYSYLLLTEDKVQTYELFRKSARSEMDKRYHKNYEKFGVFTILWNTR